MVNDSHPRVWVDGKGMRRSLGAGHAAPHCGATANATLLPQGATPSPLGLGGKTKKKSKKKKKKKKPDINHRWVLLAAAPASALHTHSRFEGVPEEVCDRACLSRGISSCTPTMLVMRTLRV
jgi:hypothetical protein